MDRLLRRLVRSSFRRARAGETAWAAVGVAAWLIQRGRRRAGGVVWRGRVDQGERLLVTTSGPGGLHRQVITVSSPGTE